MSRKDLDIRDTRLFVYNRDEYKCQHPNCEIRGFENLELAHRIGQGHKNGIKKIILQIYGKHITKKELDKIIHHPLNFATSCKKHNSFFNIGFNEMNTYYLLDKICVDLGYENG